MALQWYRLSPTSGRLEWIEAETRPGPGWEASDVPLFDSDLRPAWKALRETMAPAPPSPLPPLRVVESTPEHETTAQRQADRTYHEEMWKWHEARYPRQTLDLLGLSPEQQQMVWEGRMPAGEYRHLRPMLELARSESRSSPRVRAWWQRVHRRRSSTSQVPTGLPRRSGLRLAGHRPLTSGRRR